MYLKLENDNIIYPYSIQDLKLEHSNVSFPRNLTEEILQRYSVYKVHPKNSGVESDYTKDQREDTPILSGSIYVQNWIVTDVDQTTIEKREEIKWKEVRQERNKRLKETDWTQLPDSPVTGSKLTEWEAYRQELRDITDQVNPFHIKWPDIPS